MFGKKDSATATDPELERILVATTDTLPWQWRPVAFVSAEASGKGDDMTIGLNAAVAALRAPCSAAGARAVIGVRVSPHGAVGTKPRYYAYGTAVTWDE